MRLLVLLALAFALAACVRSNSETCKDGRICAGGLVCDEAHHLCVSRDQLESCVDRADGESCTVGGGMPRPGECVNEVCLAAGCGDGVTVLDEACDGEGSIPAVGTCADFNYDYGTLECSSQCSAGLSQCKRLGWQFASVPGTGRLYGLWEDGDTVWAVGPSHVFRRRAGVWTEVSDPALARLNADGVWARDGHVFVVGETMSGSGHVAHFDGIQWTDTALPASLHAVYGRAPDDVFVVGSGGYIGHFDGTSWTQMASPVMSELRAISGFGQEVVVAGFSSTILRLRQGVWEKDASPGRPSVGFVGVWQASANDFYAVGGLSTIAHWNGSSWVSDQLTGITRTLRGISGRSASEIYVVGDPDENGKTLFLGDGHGWTPMVNPSTEVLFAVHAGAHGTYSTTSAPTTLEYAGAGWLDLEPVAPSSTVRGVWSNGSYATSVGDACTFQVVDQGGYRTEGLFAGCTCPMNGLIDVWGPPGPGAAPLYAGGNGGALLHRTANGWECDQPVPPGLAQAATVVRSISGTSATSAFAVGRALGAPMLLHNPGTGWRDLSSVIPMLPGALLTGVWAAGPDEAFIVGNQGSIVHYQAGAAAVMASGVNVNLAGVWGASVQDVYAVGEDATILHYDGVAWQRVTGIPAGITFSTSVSFEDVHGRGSNDVWVVGGRILLHWEGAHWEVVARPDAERAFQVSASAGGVVIGTTSGIGQRLFGL